MTKRRKKEALFGILFALPVMLGFLIFVLSPPGDKSGTERDGL